MVWKNCMSRWIFFTFKLYDILQTWSTPKILIEWTMYVRWRVCPLSSNRKEVNPYVPNYRRNPRKQAKLDTKYNYIIEWLIYFWLYHVIWLVKINKFLYNLCCLRHDKTDIGNPSISLNLHLHLERYWSHFISIAILL